MVIWKWIILKPFFFFLNESESYFKSERFFITPSVCTSTVYRDYLFPPALTQQQLKSPSQFYALSSQVQSDSKIYLSSYRAILHRGQVCVAHACLLASAEQHNLLQL